MDVLTETSLTRLIERFMLVVVELFKLTDFLDTPFTQETLCSKLYQI